MLLSRKTLLYLLSFQTHISLIYINRYNWFNVRSIIWSYFHLELDIFSSLVHVLEIVFSDFRRLSVVVRGLQKNTTCYCQIKQNKHLWTCHRNVMTESCQNSRMISSILLKMFLRTMIPAVSTFLWNLKMISVNLESAFSPSKSTYVFRGKVPEVYINRKKFRVLKIFNDCSPTRKISGRGRWEVISTARLISNFDSFATILYFKNYLS